MAAYTDVDGWQNKPFWAEESSPSSLAKTMSSELRLNTYVVASTGVLKNASQVLTREQRRRLTKARTADTPVMVITQEEADANRSVEATGTQTWVFRVTTYAMWPGRPDRLSLGRLGSGCGWATGPGHGHVVLAQRR